MGSAMEALLPKKVLIQASHQHLFHWLFCDVLQLPAFTSDSLDYTLKVKGQAQTGLESSVFLGV